MKRIFLAWAIFGTAMLAWATEGPGWVQARSTAPIVVKPKNAAASHRLSPKTVGGNNCATTVTSQTGQTAISEVATPEITALARNLENDPLRIYDYVHNYIKYVHYFGSKKGALLTLLEGSGNDFDQCALLVALLKAAATNSPTQNNYTVKYQFGLMQMPYQSSTDDFDLRHWLGLTIVEAADQSNFGTYATVVANFNSSRGFPKLGPNYALFPTSDLNSVLFQRLWVKLSYPGGSTYCLDPAFKPSTFTSGIDLGAATGLNVNTLLTQAEVGAINDANSTSNLNWVNISGTLATYTANLLTDLQTTHSNYTVTQVLGGYDIEQSVSQAFPGLLFPAYTGSVVNYDNLPYSLPVLEWDNIPTAYLSTMRLQIDSVDVTYYMPALQARKVSLTFASSQAQISLDDVVDKTGTGGSGTNATMITSIAHPFGTWNFANNTVTLDHRYDQTDGGRNYQRAANGYVVAYGFDDPNQWLVKRQQKLNALIRANPGTTTPAMITETLNVIGLSWIQQTYMASGILGAQKDVLNGFHHRNGRVAQETGAQLGYYVDLPNNFYAGFWRNGLATSFATDPSTAVFSVSTFPLSAHEHGVIEQLQNNNSASTVKCLYLANKNGQKILLGTPANYSAIQTAMNGETINPYSTAEKTTLLAAVNTANSTVLVPSGKQDIGTTTPHWKGYGYAQQIQNTSSASFLMAISGSYMGGFGGDQATIIPTFTDTSFYVNSPTIFDIAPPTQVVVPGADPVNMLDGSFTVNATDITVGQPEPRGLSFSRHYDTNRRYFNQASMANGWTHNYIINAAERSDTLAGMGGNSAQEAAAYIAAMKAALDVLGTTDSHFSSVHWAVTALISEWAVDQLKTNAVNITMGSDTVQFIRRPDTGYIAPAGVSMTLTKNGSGAYVLQQRHGNTFNFDVATKRVNTIVDQYGKTMTFTYDTSSGRLTTVRDCWTASTRSLTFGYNTATPPQMTSITAATGADVANRTVGFGYTSGDLTSVTDPEGKIWSYVYDTDHKITQTKDPTLPTARIVTQNTYDSDGKVTQQLSQGNSNKTWSIYAAGRVSVQKDPNGGRTLYYYDSQSRLAGTTDPNGNTTSSVYDGQDHVIKKYSPLNEMTQFEYDGRQNLTKVTDPLGKFSVMVYDSQNNLTSTTDKRGKVTSYTYNSAFQPLTITAPNVNDDPAMPSVVTLTYNTSTDGNLATQTDQDGKVTSFLYDSYGQITRKTYPISADYDQYTSSTRGDLTQHIDARGTVLNFEYNKRRQCTKTTIVRTAGNIVTQMAYDDSANPSSATDANGNVTASVYSSTQKLTSKTLPALAAGTPVITFSYDNRDWLQSVSNPLNQTTSYVYDSGGRLVSSADPLSHATALGYDADGHKTSVTSPLAAQVQKTQYGFDGRDEMTSTTDALGFATSETFDDGGNNTAVINRNGGTFGTAFYGDNRIKTQQTPGGRITTFTYNKRGLLANSMDPMSQQTTLVYDDRGRVSTKTDGVGVSSYTYDKNSNPLTHAENSKTITRVFDELNRLTSYTDESGNVIGYQYDGQGNLTKLTYPDGKQVTYAYDSNNRLVTVTDWASGITSYTYDLAGRITGVSRPNGTSRNVSYDAAGRAVQIAETGVGGTPIALFKYTFDEANRIVNEFAAPLPADFAEIAQSAVFDSDNRLATFNGTTVVHDANGNMTSGPLNSSTAVAHGYDARNRLLSTGASGAAPSLGYGYDSEGNRTAVVRAGQTTSFVVNPVSLSQVLVRTKPDGTKTYYVYGMGLIYEVDAANSRRVYHYDNKGSTIALTDASGLVSDRVEYSSYGQVTRRTGLVDTPFLFNGACGVITDPNGLYYMRARYYNPYLRRFLNADPAGFGGGLNQYAYANGNPVSLVDPFGLWAGVDDAIAIGGGALIGLAAQGIGDLFHGQLSTWQHYAAAAAGGAAAGEATLYTGPAGGLIARAAVGGAVGGFIGNTTRQGLDIATGDQTSYSFSSAAIETGLGAGLGAGGGYIGSQVIPSALRSLSNQTKGAIGEGLSLVDNMMQGRVPVGSQVEVPLPGTYTVVDWQFRSVGDWSTLVNVEAKFGTSGLSTAQRLANNVLPNYEVDRFTYSWLANAGTALGTSVGESVGAQLVPGK